eukprot:CAMPEP_0170918186 /NCGR_PEP_ID=MMETSP0735-20130129/7829_1 /TAXON_ID=186038 /ORGANISM="Fragilariopsis kerguelensis, Strain L26-C5" /LENGTH=58 /DNA_ID=CAMNT_0011316609 /DNA_START=305 /DNA_END=477 /DNA_ORIENTATION=+
MGDDLHYRDAKGTESSGAVHGNSRGDIGPRRDGSVSISGGPMGGRDNTRRTTTTTTTT